MIFKLPDSVPTVAMYFIENFLDRVIQKFFGIPWRNVCFSDQWLLMVENKLKRKKGLCAVRVWGEME